MRALLAIALLTGVALACGPFFTVAIFTYQKHPDLPRTAYVDGRLGVVMPSYARSYLIVAYRHLTGIGFDPREREQVLSYWSDRETGAWDKIAVDWQQRWSEAYSKVPGVPKSTARKLTSGASAFDKDTNSFVLNCAEDAFRTALHTLENRTAQFGPASPALLDWATAQNTVFSNCDGETPAIPKPAPAGSPDILRQDRAYQIASAHFYARQYPEAITAFEAVAADPNSPWRTLAPYLIARTQQRAGDLDTAEQKARAILADPALASTHGITWALLRRMMVEKKSEDYFHQLSALLASRGQGNGLREEIWEFTRIFDEYAGYDPFDLPDPKKMTLAPLQRDDLPDWIATYQGFHPDSAAHAYTRWKQSNQPVWLIAALARAHARSSNAPELIRAAEQFTADSPGYLTASFHRMRLIIDAGQGATTRPALDTLIARGKLSRSSLNLFRGLRMRIAPDLTDFLRFAQRTAVLVTSDDNHAEAPDYFGDDDTKLRAARLRTLFDDDGVMVFNQSLPLTEWQQAAASTALAPELRTQVALAAFTRAVLAGNENIARTVAAQLPSLNPYTADPTPFTAAFTLLHLPESAPYLRTGIARDTPAGRIDSYRENWWCDFTPRADLGLYHAGSAPEKKDQPDLAPGIALTTTSAAAERKALERAGGGSRYLGRIVLAYAKSHADDPRVPEALHLAVRANRYACDATSDWETARDCFRLLHARYPKSEWTRKTPVWNR